MCLHFSRSTPSLLQAFASEMEAWRRELQNSITVALNDSDEEEEELLTKSLVFGHGASNSEEEARGCGRRSMLGQCFVHRDM